MNSQALIVDDEPDIRELLEITLGRMKIDTFTAANVTAAKKLLSEKKFDLCLTDMRLPDGNGIELVQYIQKIQPELPVAVLTAFGNMDTAVTALKAGAFDFVSKPVDLERLRGLIDKALKLTSGLSEKEESNSPFQIIGQSPAIKTLQLEIHKFARSQAPVYISGESGSGKELVARLIHQMGPRSEAPFIPVNCGAIPSELMESEFFGHKKGSFTGAVEDKIGLFQAAHGGTLFLDEVADLPLHMQVKLLRAIQEKSIRPIGTQKEISVDIRILSATHKDLAIEVEGGHFRQDLFYRINVIPLSVPPLRDRKEDIPILSEHFIQRLSKEWQLTTPTLTSAAKGALFAYAFPGNVRELENILERALTLCDTNDITAENLQLPATQVAGIDTHSSTHSTSSTNTRASSPPTPSASLPEGQTLETYLTDIEKNIILHALDETRWNRTAAAKNLGMTFRSLRYRLKKLELDDGKGE
ncbi:MAG: sigma-54 dependent transcriptional regulator [Pseudomonadales bacterium]|nr:sigma-54 dependent transcriptional regulator [Pseudomonadales bacterium]